MKKIIMVLTFLIFAAQAQADVNTLKKVNGDYVANTGPDSPVSTSYYYNSSSNEIVNGDGIAFKCNISTNICVTIEYLNNNSKRTYCLKVLDNGNMLYLATGGSRGINGERLIYLNDYRRFLQKTPSCDKRC